MADIRRHEFVKNVLAQIWALEISSRGNYEVLEVPICRGLHLILRTEKWQAKEFFVDRQEGLDVAPLEAQRE